jgi:hypothetical protein
VLLMKRDLSFWKTLNASSACRIVTSRNIDSGVVGLYLAHARDSSVSKHQVPLNAIPKHFRRFNAPPVEKISHAHR